MLEKRILFLSNPESSHTKRWANALAERGYRIHIIGLSEYDGNGYLSDNISLDSMGLSCIADGKSDGVLSKVKYLKGIYKIRREIQTFKPHIVHAHYATSMGLLGVLSGFHPLIISTWGSDIYLFPNRTRLHRRLLCYILSKADCILSTSYAMSHEAKQYINDRRIDITPFGVDTDLFKSVQVPSLFGEKDIVIGTIKLFDYNYGIDRLVEAFNILTHKFPDLPLKLLLVGGGNDEQKIREQVNSYDLADKVLIMGAIPHEDTVKYYNMLDVYVALSRNESFGVAVLEAAACEKPVIVSNAGGLPEIVEDGVNGIIIPDGSPELAEQALEKLILNSEMRLNMGKRGREIVKKKYEWHDCVNKMEHIYRLFCPETVTK